MAEDTKPADTKAPKAPKVGDTVHLVHHTGAPGQRFAKAHAEAKVTKVHQKGAFVDLECLDLPASPKTPALPLVITQAPRDDSGQTPDTWHFPEPESV